MSKLKTKSDLVKTTTKNLKLEDITIAVLGSHSALDVCRGAKDLGFKTLVIVKDKRDQTYEKYYRTSGNLGCVDEVLYVDDFKDLLKPKIQKILNAKNSIFIPHRSFEVYVDDYDGIEKRFKVPMFGNRKLLRYEERNQKPNQYDLLEKAGIKYPKQFNQPEDIDRLCIVKVPERERKFERRFFLVNSHAGYKHESQRLIDEGEITKEALEKAVIEEFIVGVQVNFNFFYPPVSRRLELIGTDTRRQTNLDGLLRLTENHQRQILTDHIVEPKYEEAGHIAVTVLESLLEDAFAMGERLVKVSQKMVPPGVIGPFALQTVITPGPPKKEIIVFDVSPRMPGSPGIFATPYSGYLYGQNISMGKRVAMEIKEVLEKGELDKVLT